MMSKRPPLHAVAFALLIAAAGGAAAWQLHLAEVDSAQARADVLVAQANVQLDQQVAMLEAFAGFAEELPELEKPAFDRLYQRVAGGGRGRGMQGLGYAQRHDVNATDRQLERIRQNYGVRPVPPPTDQRQRATIMLLNPLNAPNRAALGFDMHAERRRRAAMERAVATGAPAASEMVTLVQERVSTAPQPGFLIYVPVRASDARTRGFIYAPYRVHDLLSSVLGGHAQGGTGFVVRAGTNENAPVLRRLGDISGASVRRQLRIADRQWIIDIYDRRFEFWRSSPAILLIGSLLAGLLAGLLLTAMSRRAESLATLAEERAGRARDKDVLLAEMAHRLKNSYARIAALISMTAREFSTVESFAPALRGRVHALADSVTLITSGAGGTALLNELLDAELRRSCPDLRLDNVAAGPPLVLAEQEAHAIGLILHELATNSVKYGALGGNGQLRVQWLTEAGEARLLWTESDLNPPPTINTEGFGSQFLRTIVTRQLRGTIERTVDGASLLISLHWPRPKA